jgi:serine/threonine-protein kinase
MASEPKASRLRCGELIAKRYRLLEVIGTGGQGTVYRAVDERTVSDVAVKVLASRDADSVMRAFREANVMSQLEGTSAVRTIGDTRTDDGAIALVMELLVGRDLDDELEAREKKGLRADRAFVEMTFEPVVRTLTRAHELGIVHRDIKTNNIFIIDEARGGGIRVLDFGFAKLVRVAKITHHDMIAGSPSYLAPEVWRHGSSDADSLVDVYALGVVLYRTLAGELPFVSKNIPDLVMSVNSGPRPSLHAIRPDLPPVIDGWVEHVLAIPRDRRFANVAAAWRALLACL